MKRFDWMVHGSLMAWATAFFVFMSCASSGFTFAKLGYSLLLAFVAAPVLNAMRNTEEL